jgi:hypothetical protein
MKTLLKVEAIDEWIRLLKGRDRPTAECHKSIQKTIRRIDNLKFKAQAIIRFNSKINMIEYGEGLLVSSTIAWLKINATGAYFHDMRGPRIFLEFESDAALFKLAHM